MKQCDKFHAGRRGEKVLQEDAAKGEINFGCDVYRVDRKQLRRRNKLKKLMD